MEYLAKSCSLEYYLLLHFFIPTIQLSHQCEVMCHLYELLFYAGTSNNIFVFSWWLFIYSGAKFAYLPFVLIDFYKLVS
jgi:hypothetical protein